MRGLVLRWCMYTDTYVGARLLALLAGLADLWPRQQQAPRDRQALGFKPPRQFPAFAQLRRSEDQIWKGGQYHSANQDVLRGHRRSGTGAARFDLSTGGTTCSKRTFTPAGWAPQPAEQRTRWPGEGAVTASEGQRGMSRKGGLRTVVCLWALTRPSPSSRGTGKVP